MENYQILLWTIGVVVLAIVVLYALGKGYNVRLKRNNMEASFEKNDKRPAQASVSVGKGIKIQGSKTGDISGIKADTSGGSPTTAAAAPIDVMQNAKIDDSELGDISGIKTTPGSKNVVTK
jgi:hypothetical protein